MLGARLACAHPGEQLEHLVRVGVTVRVRVGVRVGVRVRVRARVRLG